MNYVVTINHRRATGQTYTAEQAAEVLLDARESGDKVEIFVAHDDLGRRYRIADREQIQPVLDAAVTQQEEQR